MRPPGRAPINEVDGEAAALSERFSLAEPYAQGREVSMTKDEGKQ
jgi:hypothetical protein